MKRNYPPVPMVGVGVVVQKDKTLLLVKRGHEPKKGLWSIPGGLIEVGESVRAAAIREVREECNIEIQLQDVISVVDLIEKDDDENVKYHFVIIDFLAKYTSGELTPGSDAADAAWVTREQLGDYDIPELTQKLLEQVFE